MTPLPARRLALAAALTLCTIAWGAVLLRNLYHPADIDRLPGKATAAPSRPSSPEAGRPFAAVSHDWIEAGPAEPRGESSNGELADPWSADPARWTSRSLLARCRNCRRIHLFPAVL